MKPMILLTALATSTTLIVPAARAQTAISADGVVESRSGGFRFPDGTLQTTAAGGSPCPTLDRSDEMIWVAGVCVDKYEASIWDAPVGGNQITGEIPCGRDGQDCDNIWARSVAGVQPRGSISWLQAQQALANSGKRLLTNAEWQMAAAGTPDPGASPGSEDCNSDFDFEVTGERTNCVSRWGAHDMVGNVSELVADWVLFSTSCGDWSILSDDLMCFAGSTFATSSPGVLIRGGANDSGAGAGPLAISVWTPGAAGAPSIGFRGAR